MMSHDQTLHMSCLSHFNYYRTNLKPFLFSIYFISVVYYMHIFFSGSLYFFFLSVFVEFFMVFFFIWFGGFGFFYYYFILGFLFCFVTLCSLITSH